MATPGVKVQVQPIDSGKFILLKIIL